MMIFKKAIPRRTFLRGAGASLALPFLDAMVPALAAGNVSAPPLRVSYIYLPVGRIMENWTPTTEGSDFELTPTLKPLAAYRDQMRILSGMDVKAAHLLPGESGGPHARPNAAYLTGVHPYHDKVGISVDQVVAKHVSQETPIASLELNVDPSGWAGQGNGDYNGFYTSTLSWRSSTTPLPTQDNPRKVFERLFGDTDTLNSEVMQQRLQNKGSVLDYVNARVNKLMASVNMNDRHRIEEYLDSVREIERSIQVAESRTDTDVNSEAFKDIKRPAGIPGDYAEHVRLMFDLMVLAYQTNMTRVVTFMLGHEGTNRNFTELGALDGHHSLSHHKGDSRSIDLLRKIDLYQSQQLTYFLDKMQATKELDGSSLLDNSIVIAGSSLSDANYHIHNDVPTMVLGSAQNKLKKGGRHIRYNSDPLSNLHLTVLDLFGAPSEEYLSSETSDGTGILKEIVS
jgi:hypothetical protein